MLDQSGIDVRTVAVTDTAGTLPFQVLGRSRLDPRTLLSLRKASLESDVIVVHGSLGLWPTTVLTALNGKPFIYRNIGDPTYWTSVQLRKLRIEAPLHRAERIVALTPTIADWISENIGVPRSSVSVIPNAVDTKLFPPRDADARRALRSTLGLDEHTFVLGYLGALSGEKRPLLAVSSVAGRPDAHLVLAGDGPLSAEVAAAGEELAPGRVHMLGSVRRPADMLSAVDALLLPSRTEGMPASLIEAALVGVPVVSTAVGAIPDMLEELGHGIAVPVDDEDAFIEAVRTFDPSDYDMAAARQAAMHYDITAVAERWIEVLRSAPLG
jgi:glycosyltransferase involved in cell wall biosynthesis